MNRTTELTFMHITMNICALCCAGLMFYSAYRADWMMAFFCAFYTIGCRIMAVCAQDIKKSSGRS